MIHVRSSTDPAARTNIWTIAIERAQFFTCRLRREESGRRFRVQFDLTKLVAPRLH